MAQVFNNAVVTDAGVALIAACEAAGDPIVFTRVVTGDGVHTDKTPAALKVRTALINQKQTVSLSSKRAVTNACKITAVISNATLVTGYYMNELGLYAQQGSDSSTEVLFNIAVVAASQGDWFPPYNGTSPAEIVQSFVISSANDLNVQIALESDSFALKAELGDLDDLTTTDKDNVVEAINEVRDEVRPISRGGTGFSYAFDALNNLGGVQLGATATKNTDSQVATSDYLGGKIFCKDGYLYKATKKIAIGDTIYLTGVNKNAKMVLLADEVSDSAGKEALADYTENEFKATRNYHTVGVYIYIRATRELYKTTVSIDYDETLDTSTNIEQATVGGELARLNSDLAPQDISSAFTSDSNFALYYAVKINGVVYLAFEANNVSTSGNVYVKAGLMSSNKPNAVTAIMLAPGSNNTALAQGYIDTTGQLVIRSGGTALSGASYVVMAIYRT